MKAITTLRYGDPGVLELTDAPEPKVAADAVLVRIKATGVNPADWKLVGGDLDALVEVHFPLIPGWDMAGVVEAVGLDATEFSVGDEVFGYVHKDEIQHGTYAELVAAPVNTLAAKPAALSWEQAAGLPLAGLTAYQALSRIGVTKGDIVLVHAAAGGVGSLAVQIAVAWGARVIGTAGEHNHDFIRSLGGEPVSYGDGLAERVRESAPGGVTAAVDFIGDGVAQLSQTLLVDPTRIASVVDGTIVTSGGHHVWARTSTADLTALARLADEGRLTVHVDRVLPLAQAADALRLSLLGRTRGKIVLTAG